MKTDIVPSSTKEEFVTKAVQEIIETKHNVGPDAYLWLHSSGNCILWLNAESYNDGDVMSAIMRWLLTDEEQQELIQTGEVNDIE